MSAPPVSDGQDWMRRQQKESDLAKRRGNPFPRIAALETGYRLIQTLYITASTTFDKDDYPELAAIEVEVLGGGGAGGGAAAPGASNHTKGGGGGAGAWAKRFITDIEGLASSVTLTVGAGGTGVSGTTGNAGGTTTFADPTYPCTADGGSGGSAAATTNLFTAALGGGGGFPVAGDFQVRGVTGFNGTGTGALGTGGNGGSSPHGSGGRGAYTGAGSGSQNGAAAGGYGSGGGGASSNASGAAATGGAGTAGIIILRLYA